MKIAHRQFIQQHTILDLTRPSLEGLAYILRHKELWPKNFEWEFYRCDRCAMGLAYRLWRGIKSPEFQIMADRFYMEKMDAYRIFIIGTKEGDPVTPERVARRIEEYLAQRQEGK